MNDSENKRIKVLFLDQAIKDGGGGRSLFYLLKFIDKRRFEPIAYLPREKGILGERLVQENVCRVIFENRIHSDNNISRTPGKTASEEKFMQRIVSLARNYLELFYLIIFKLPRMIRREHIDILYSNNTTTRFVTAIAGALTGTKVVLHIRNVPDKFSYVAFKALNKLSAIRKVICVSHSTLSHFPSDPEKSMVVHNGIDTTEFDRRVIQTRLKEEYKLPADVIVFGVTGRLLPKKGYISFIRAGHLAMEACPGSEIRIVIMGGAGDPREQRHLEELKQLAEQLNISEKVIITGFKADVKPYVGDFDILVVPSMWPEPCPRTVLEGMALSLPILGYSTGGIPELVEQNRTGLLYEHGDFVKLAEGMTTLIRNKELRISFGIAARRRVEEFFEIEHQTREIETVLLNL